jgi:hypothetical protein
MRLAFLGGAGTRTGLPYLVSDKEHRLPEDCGNVPGSTNLTPESTGAAPPNAKARN